MKPRDERLRLILLTFNARIAREVARLMDQLKRLDKPRRAK